MKQTIELEGNRKAVVEIPYSKLTGNSTAYQQAPQNSHCCDSKVVLVGCNPRGRQNNAEIKTIISELEESYDKDVKQLQDKITEVERERDGLRKAHADELSKLRQDY